MLLIMVAWASVLWADDERLDPSGGSYCGIYAVYGALQAIGVECDFEKLLERKYVGSRSGSSLPELRAAVEDMGAAATSLEGLTAASIRFARYPLILHVRPPGKDTEYSHWVLVLGMRGDKAVVVDTPEPPYEMSVAQLLAASDGMGLYVRPKDADVLPLVLESRLTLLPMIFGIAVGLVGFGLVSRRLRPSWAMGTLGIVIVAASAAAIEHFGAFGFARNDAAVAYVRGRRFAPELPEMSAQQLRDLMKTSDVAVVDARIPVDFASGHIPGARNIPIFSGLVARDRAVPDLQKAKTVVVYCQSESCAWGKSLASDLALRGIKDVRLMPGGWIDWEEMDSSSKGKANGND
jgi:rhodanese-related sulfurtransferase